MVRRRLLGKTGLMVSELSLGTVELGLDYGIPAAGERLKPDESQAAVVLHAALDLGINLLDTARAYGDAEEIIGRVLKARRNEFLLVSKVPSDPTRVRQSVEESLRALQTDHIDIMLIHCGADAQPDTATAAELLKCRDAGMLRYTGASVYGEAAAMTAIESDWCDCVEIAYNLLDRRPERRILARASERQVGILARSVLLKGALTTRCRQLSDDFRPLTASVEHILETTQTEIDALPELAYRYVLTAEPPHSALVGTARLGELRECVAFAQKGPVAPDILTRIRKIPMPPERWLNPGNWPS